MIKPLIVAIVNGLPKSPWIHGKVGVGISMIIGDLG
jgi:hypothetical protein